MITKQQYVRLSLVLFLPLLGLGYYLAERRIFNPLEHAVFCVVDDGTCTISKMDERKLQENLEDSIFIFQDTKASLSVINPRWRSPSNVGAIFGRSRLIGPTNCAAILSIIP